MSLQQFNGSVEREEATTRWLERVEFVVVVFPERERAQTSRLPQPGRCRLALSAGLCICHHEARAGLAARILE
jgi:hypothetical protein